jgi:hypothetical protein
MSQTVSQSGAFPALRLVVSGRIQQVVKRQTQAGDVFKTLIKTPAPDSYSSPGTFEVRSRKRLGSEGQEVSVECDLMGYARQYENKDGETVKTSEHVLQAA